MKFRQQLFLFFLVFCVIEGIRAGRISSGSRSRSSSRSSYSSSRPSVSRGTSSGGSQTHRPSGSTSFGTSHSSFPSHGTSGQTTPQRNKDLSSTFLHAEGGGATRPAQVKPPTSFGGSHSPSAPSAPAGSHTPSAPYPYGGAGYGANAPKQTSPHVPSAPPAPVETVQKNAIGTTHNQAPTSFGQPGTSYNPGQGNAPWSNPHLGPSQPGLGSQPPHVGFKESLHTPSIATGGNSHYPNPPYPVQGSGAPYPVHGANAPYPVHGANPPYPVPHGSNVPYPSGGPSFGHPSYHPSYNPSAPPMPVQNNFNSFGHPSQPPMGNPYSTYQAGSPYAAPGQQPQYAPQMLSQPAAQPYVPGHTVIMMPGQQDSGRGLGQVFKEALVFSTVNAAVNRVINPHHHYVSDSRPAESSGSAAAPTTHITYNNQYFNTYPGANGTDLASLPQGVPPLNPAGVPGSSGISYPTGPGSPNVVGLPAGNPANTGPSAGDVAATGAAMIPGPSGIQAPQTTQGNTTNATVTPANVVPQYKISDDDLLKISEELFEMQAVNLTKYVTLNLQNRSTSVFPNITDEATEPLLVIQPEILEYPTVYVTRALYDNYEFDSRKKENRTLDKRMEENLLIDTFLETSVLSRAMSWLAEHGFIDPDDFERKDILRRVWFNQFDGSTSGFERVFTAEKYGDTDILGVQDWIYFEYKEAKNELDYMGYVDKLDLGNNASLVKLNFQMDGVIRPNATIFLGTLPELEMSLYTICFYARPNNLCPVSLGGVKFNLFTHSFRYYGNDLIDLGMPIF